MEEEKGQISWINSLKVFKTPHLAGWGTPNAVSQPWSPPGSPGGCSLPAQPQGLTHGHSHRITESQNGRVWKGPLWVI